MKKNDETEKKNRILNRENIIIIIIFVLAIILRLIYVVRTPYISRQHDLEFPNTGGGGLDYIRVIYDTGRLPNTNIGQYYHPPLYYYSSAIFMRIISIFTNDTNILYESLQWLIAIYSVILLFIVKRILEKLKVNYKYIIFILSIMAIHPAFILLSGTINNDILSIVFIFWTLLRLIKWYENDNAKNTLILGIVIGLSVMTKTSRSYLCIPNYICCI